MIITFADHGTEDLFNGLNSIVARRTCPDRLRSVARRRLELLDSVTSIDELRIPPGNRLEALKGDRQGQYSIRINEQYRICFKWTVEGPVDVGIVDYH
jgi:proteic killer suppression protein